LARNRRHQRLFLEGWQVEHRDARGGGGAQVDDAPGPGVGAVAAPQLVAVRDVGGREVEQLMARTVIGDDRALRDGMCAAAERQRPCRRAVAAPEVGGAEEERPFRGRQPAGRWPPAEQRRATRRSVATPEAGGGAKETTAVPARQT